MDVVRKKTISLAPQAARRECLRLDPRRGCSTNAMMCLARVDAVRFTLPVTAKVFLVWLPYDSQSYANVDG